MATTSRVLPICLSTLTIALAGAAGPREFNVVWDSPSRDAHGSMPLGNGDLGVNAWVEPSGDLVFYVGKTDAWDDYSRLLKIGRVRVRLDPAPPLQPFHQELSLETGTVNVRYGDGTTLRIWVESAHPVVRVDVAARRPVTATARAELWRTNRFELPAIECSDVLTDRSRSNGMHGATIVEPDTVLTGLRDRVGWYHRNLKSIGPDLHAEIQGVTGYRRADPLLHRTFGALLTAAKARRLDDLALQSPAATEHHFALHVLTRHPSTADAWLQELMALVARGQETSLDERRRAHELWWRAFWDRSWIRATRNPRHPLAAPAAPSNGHPLRVGVDQSGGNRFAGELRAVRVPDRLDGAFALAAEARPAVGEQGRIFDKITPGGADGFLLDAHPGNSLRLIVGARQYHAAGALPAGQWARIEARADADGWRVSVDGREVINTRESSVADDAGYVSRMYALQRFITACAGRGAYPIKFNGSLFTVPAEGMPGDADYRRWGPGYWWQNTRLPYLSLCTSGDFEMLEPLFRMYVDDLLPFNRYRTREYFGFDGAYYAECIHFWGDVFNETYGWTPRSRRPDPLQESGYHKWEWVAGPELVWMLLEAYDHTGDLRLLQQRILPSAEAVIRFFEGYYRTNTVGQLVLHPAQALETWWECTNPMPELAGLHAITARLLALPESVTPAATRAHWRAFAAQLPPLPTRETPDGPAWAPAERFQAKRNVENPELYAVFPFRLCAFEKPNRDLGLRALAHRWDRGDFGWRQDDLFMAYLGLADAAREQVVSRARNHDPDSRFPAFWGPNYDWVPDQDHGGVLIKALQAMLLQSDGPRIHLLPAWPKAWDVEFKLHAPRQTIVECVVRDGIIVSLKVDPESRRADVMLPAASGPGAAVWVDGATSAALAAAFQRQ